MRWIEEKGCLPPGVSPTAVPYYGSGVVPVNVRPPFLHDGGGVAPGLIAQKKDGGAVGQPYNYESWTYRFYGPDGYLIYSSPTPEKRLHSDGIARLQQLYNSSPSAISKVCGVYTTYYGSGARYCYSAAGLKVETTTPTWAGTLECRPGSSLNSSGHCVGSPLPVPPIAIPPGRPSPCLPIQQAIANLQAARNGLVNDLAMASQAYNAAVKAGNTAAAQSLSAVIYDIKSSITNVDGEIVKAKAALAACQGAPVFPTPCPAGMTWDPVLARCVASIPVVPYRPFGTTTFVQTTTTTQARPPLFGQTVTFTPLTGPQWLGQACDDVKAAIANLESARGQLSQNLLDASGQYNAAVKAGNTEAAQGLSAVVYDIKSNISNVDGEIVKAKAALAACEAGSAAPPPQTQCANDHPDCGNAGFICVNGDCVPGCRNDGDCGAGFRCVKKDANGIGQCEPIPPKKASAAGGWGIVLLALAAVGAIFTRGGVADEI